MPPTTSEIAAMPMSSIESAPKIASCIAWNSACERIAKSSSSPSLMRWRWRRIASACSFARSDVDSAVALRRSACVSYGRVKRTCVRIVVMGMRTISSWLWPNGDWPFSSRMPTTR